MAIVCNIVIKRKNDRTAGEVYAAEGDSRVYLGTLPGHQSRRNPLGEYNARKAWKAKYNLINRWVSVTFKPITSRIL
jgi:hypothetical protein